MMKHFCLWTFVVPLIFVTAGCGHKKKSAEVAAVMGIDTLTVSQVETLRPDSMPSTTRVTTVMAQRALARRCRTAMGGAQRDTVLSALMQQLSLRSGVEWNREAAGSYVRTMVFSHASFRPGHVPFAKQSCSSYSRQRKPPASASQAVPASGAQRESKGRERRSG